MLGHYGPFDAERQKALDLFVQHLTASDTPGYYGRVGVELAIYDGQVTSRTNIDVRTSRSQNGHSRQPKRAPQSVTN